MSAAAVAAEMGFPAAAAFCQEAAAGSRAHAPRWSELLQCSPGVEKGVERELGKSRCGFLK